MWTSFSASRWICLLTLAAVMLISASQVDSFPSYAHACCERAQTRKVKDIMKCNKQESRRSCPHNAFLIVSSSSSKPICVQQNAQWLQKLLDEKKLICPSQFSAKGRFEVLDDEDDVEW
ncbi:uncharacterized protein AB9X84_025708 [Acanthopagrus schlegelii]